MNYCALALLALGVAQAAQLSATAQESNTHEDTNELTIKMPDAAVPETKVEKKATSQSLVQAETGTQLGMFESGVLHASLKPIVKAKAQKVMDFLEATNEEYSHGTEDQKKTIQKKAHSLIMLGTGTRAFNLALCDLLWAALTEIASKLSNHYCPALIFPAQSAAGTPALAAVNADPPSRMRSAFLTQYFWGFMLGNNKNSVISMLDANVYYYWGNDAPLVGSVQVGKSMPFIGFPADSQLSHPTSWHCDATTCIAPVKAWSKHENYCLTTFKNTGKVTEVIVPLQLWR